MPTMFKSFFSCFTSFFRTCDKFVRSVEQISDYTLAEATDFNDRSILERKAGLVELQKTLKLVNAS